MSALQYPICTYSGVVTDIFEREFYSPATLQFPPPVPATSEIMERTVYEVTLEPELSNSVESTPNSSVARITPPAKPKRSKSSSTPNDLSVSKCIVYVYHAAGAPASDIGMHDVIQMEGRLCEGEDRSTQGEDDWDEMEVEASEGKVEKVGVSEIHCTKISIGRTPPPLTDDQIKHLKSGLTYDAFVSLLSGSSPTGIGKLRAAVFAAWVMGWREGEGDDVGGVDLVIDGDKDGFMKLTKYFATSGTIKIDGTKECHLSKRGGIIKGGPQMGEGGVVIVEGDMIAEVQEIVRTKRVRCLFQFGEGLMNADLRFVDFNPKSKRKHSRGNVFMKSPSDGWVGLTTESLNGSALFEFVDYVDYVRANRPAVIFGDTSCKVIEDTFVSLRQEFAAGGAKITEHDLETWMVIMRGRVRGRGGGEVVKQDVDWAVKAWKAGRNGLE